MIENSKCHLWDPLENENRKSRAHFSGFRGAGGPDLGPEIWDSGGQNLVIFGGRNVHFFGVIFGHFFELFLPPSIMGPVGIYKSVFEIENDPKKVPQKSPHFDPQIGQILTPPRDPPGPGFWAPGPENTPIWGPPGPGFWPPGPPDLGPGPPGSGARNPESGAPNPGLEISPPPIIFLRWSN